MDEEYLGKPGDMITISGNQSKNRPNSLWITRVQLANGQELPGWWCGELGLIGRRLNARDELNTPSIFKASASLSGSINLAGSSHGSHKEFLTSSNGGYLTIHGGDARCVPRRKPCVQTELTL